MPHSSRPTAQLVAATVAFTLACAATPKATHACSELPVCTPPVRLFPGNYPIPGNLVYFKVLVDDPGTLVLRVVGGAPIEASIRMLGSDRVFAPLVPIAAETEIELDYTTVCPPAGQLKLTPSQAWHEACS